MKIFKRLFCKHEFKTITNLYGDAINRFNARSIAQCIHCGKAVFSGRLDPNCKKVNAYWEVNHE